jgi:DNA polymerase-1
MRALIDADTPAYASAAVAEGTDSQTAVWETHKSIERILTALNTQDYTLYLTGENNFRYTVFPEYKANRLHTPRPTFLPDTRQCLIDNYDTIVSDGCEADDLLGIEQTISNANGEETIIVSIDKDLDQIPGWHYFPGLRRQGVEIRPPRQYLVSPVEARRFFYYQLLVGDSADGIKGAVGIGPKKAEKILEGLTEEIDLYNVVKDFFSCEEELIMNAKVLKIWTTMNEEWKPPIEAT